MKLVGLDYFDLSTHLSENECRVQQSTREFVDNEILPIINEHFENFGNDLVIIIVRKNMDFPFKNLFVTQI